MPGAHMPSSISLRWKNTPSTTRVRAIPAEESSSMALRGILAAVRRVITFETTSATPTRMLLRKASETPADLEELVLLVLLFCQFLVSASSLEYVHGVLQDDVDSGELEEEHEAEGDDEGLHHGGGDEVPHVDLSREKEAYKSLLDILNARNISYSSVRLFLSFPFRRALQIRELSRHVPVGSPHHS